MQSSPPDTEEKNLSPSWKELKSSCRRDSDYPLTALLINRISLVLTWVLIPLRIHPNTVTLFSILTGLTVGVAYSYGHLWTASGLIIISHVLDCTDGNLARATRTFSPMGRLLDWVSDRLVELSIFAGAGWFATLNSRNPLWLLIAFISFGLVQTYYYLVDAAPKAGTGGGVTAIGTTKEGIKIKLGIFEPVLYGFVILGPFNLLHIQFIAAGTAAFAGLIYQIIVKSRK